MERPPEEPRVPEPPPPPGEPSPAAMPSAGAAMPSAGDVLEPLAPIQPFSGEAMTNATAPVADQPGPPSHSTFWLLLLLGLVGYVGLWFGNQEMQRIAMAAIEVLPFLGLALLASLGIRHLWARVLTLIYWFVLVGGMGLLAVVLALMAVINPDTLAKRNEFGPGNAPDTIFLPGGGWQVLLTFLGVAAVVPLGLVGYAPPVRRALLHRSPFEADSFVHATALATIIGITLICFIPLIVLGEPPVLLLLDHFQGTELAEQLSRAESIRDQLYGLMWLVPTAILAAGYPIRHSLRETLQRVGLVRPRLWQIVFAVAVSGLLVLLTTGLDQMINRLWQELGWPMTDATTFSELIKFAINPLGAVVIGVTAGLGEELAVRGVLQPRLGILLSNLFFTALHAFQYNFDGLLSVFVLGLVLGSMRKYTNTTTSAIVHGLYDFTLVLLVYLEVPGF
jgi:uncharacterized protein